MRRIRVEPETVTTTDDHFKAWCRCDPCLLPKFRGVLYCQTIDLCLRRGRTHAEFLAPLASENHFNESPGPLTLYAKQGRKKREEKEKFLMQERKKKKMLNADALVSRFLTHCGKRVPHLSFSKGM